ncbi:MAG: S9 family peptidase [Armatimonadetes bacterium]|nr:S9 family peptidase [Armatimonadota bacterium]
MRTAALAILLFLAQVGCALAQGLHYPLAPPGAVVEDYHGTRVSDPYRWLEDPDSPQTRKWIEAENKVTFSYLDQVPIRPKIRERLTRLWNYERYGVPHREGERYFFRKNDGLQNQSVLYWTDRLDAPPRVLLDPNKLSSDGTVALSGYALTRDGHKMAYGISVAGSDWNEWKVRDVASGQDLPDLLKWVKFSGASWTSDGKGFFYSRYDAPDEKRKLEAVNYFQKLCYHEVGTPQEKDVLVYHRPDEKEWGFGGDVTDDGKYLIISVSKGTDHRNQILYKDLQKGIGAPAVPLIDKWEAEYAFVGNNGPLFWFRTTLDAPRGRLIAIDIRRPARENWKTVVPEISDTLQNVSLVGDTFIATYMHDAHTAVKTFSLDGTAGASISLPGIGTAAGFYGHRADKETFYSFASYTTPSTIFHYDLATGRSTVFRKPQVDFNPADYVTKQVFFNSKDGTRVPMFITHRKDLKLDGNNPTHLYGYGGFDISIQPQFSVSALVWMEHGGVYCVANLRGGGEYGEEWHQAGMKLKKQNVFDDFIGAAEWLIANKYTRPKRLAISGYSNGGLLVGAMITQRPDLFGAALPGVGVLDMLRFHKFTIGWAWTSDYGSPDNADEFKALYAYSPLHNIKPGTAYPPTMIVTADHDDRVVPAHSFKFAAALQAAQKGPAPVLIRIETRAGHGAGKPTTKIIAEAADTLSFFMRALQMPGGAPANQS